MDKYFLDDVCNRKEIHFLELELGNTYVVDYAVKFEEVYKYYPHYNGADAKGSKCVKFENGLRLKSSLLFIKKFVASQ